MIELSIANRPCRLFGSETPDCILVQPSARHENASLEAEVTQLAALIGRPFLLVTIELEDWTIDLMPWPDGNISRDPEAGRHGQETLDYILQDLFPELERRFGPLPVILGGYSLGRPFRPLDRHPDGPLPGHRRRIPVRLDPWLDSLRQKAQAPG